MKRVDERNTMFARANYKKDSTAYNDYYKKNPDKKESEIGVDMKKITVKKLI